MNISDQLTTELLSRTLATVLEQAAFVFTEPLDDHEGPTVWSSEDIIRVRLAVEIEGSTSALWLLCEHAAGVSLAANLLGIEPEDEQATHKAIDAAGELLNIVCGAVLDEACGSTLEYRLGTPEISRCAANACMDLPGDALSIARLSTEEGHLLELQLRSA